MSAFWTSVPLVVVFAGAALPLATLTIRFAGRPGLALSSLTPALAFALPGAVLSAIVGGSLGIAAGTLEVPGRRWAIGISAALLAAPPAFWWLGLTRVSVVLGRLSGTVPGGVVAGLVLAPITLLLVLAATREIPSNAYQAARLSLGPVSRVWFVLVPLLRPALIAGFLLTGILLLGESEIPFLFGFRTSMTEVVTTFSQTFDAGRTVPVIVPLVITVLAMALMLARPLFRVVLAAPKGGLGIVRKPGNSLISVAMLALPTLMCLSLGGYARAAASGAADAWRRVPVDMSTLVISIAEPVLCGLAAATLAVLVAYSARRTSAVRWFAVAGLLLFCVPTAVTAIGWIAIGQATGVSIPPAVAFVTRMLGLSVLGFLIAYSRVPRSLEDAAQLVSLSPVGRAWVLVLPLLETSLAATAALAAALIFADRDVASLLLSPGASRLMLNLYLLSANAPSGVVGATALVTFLTGGVVIALAVAGPTALLMRRRE